MLNDEYKDVVLQKILLHNQLVSEEDLEEAIALQEEIEDLGVPLELSHILLQKNLLTEEKLKSLNRYISVKFKYFSSILPLRIQHPTLSESSLPDQLIAVGKISEQDVEDLKSLREQIQDRGVEVSLRELLVKQDYLDIDELEQFTIPVAEDESEEFGADTRRWKTTEAKIDRKDAFDFRSSEARTLGKLVVKNGLITPEQLEDALRIQSSLENQGIEMKIGEIFVEKGYTSQEAVEEMLSLQQLLRGDELKSVLDTESVPHSEPDESLIGKLALENDLITERELSDCLEMQENIRFMGMNVPLGKIMIKQDLVSTEEVKKLLELQDEQRDESL